MTPIQIEISALTDIKERRAFLSQICKPLKTLVAQEMYSTLNQAIVEIVYKPEGHTTLKSFEQWKREGKRVRKGEKALIVWGSPKFSETSDNSGESAEKFFPLCYLFSNLQVE